MVYKSIFQKIIGCIGIGFILLHLVSCAHYHAKPLAKQYILERHIAPVSVTVRSFTKEDCHRYLDNNVLEKGVQPLQITIYNNIDATLLFTKESLDIPQLSSQEMTQLFQTSTSGRVIGYGALGLFVWPFFIPAIMDGVKSWKSNKEMEKDYMKKSYIDCQIMPYSIVTGLIFVPIKEIHLPFLLKLINQETQEELTFSLEFKKDELAT